MSEGRGSSEKESPGGDRGGIFESSRRVTRLVEEAKTCMVEQRFDKALRCLDIAVDIQPKSYAPRKLRCVAALCADRFEVALADAEALVSQHPQRAEGLALRGHSLSRMGRHKEAAEAFKAALGITPSDKHLQGAFMRSLTLFNASKSRRDAYQEMANLGRELLRRDTYVDVHRVREELKIATLVREAVRAEEEQLAQVAAAQAEEEGRGAGGDEGAAEGGEGDAGDAGEGQPFSMDNLLQMLGEEGVAGAGDGTPEGPPGAPATASPRAAANETPGRSSSGSKASLARGRSYEVASKTSSRGVGGFRVDRMGPIYGS